MALCRYVTYYGDKKDKHGMPEPCFRYCVMACDSIEAGSGLAMIMSLTGAEANAIEEGPPYTVIATEGGKERALRMAEESLDKKHPALEKSIRDGRRISTVTFWSDDN